jgi:Ca2+-binding RTX toxin-like protein
VRRALALTILLAALTVAPEAQASSTIGQVFTPTAQTTATVAQTSVASGVGYRVPSDGVITAWSFQADTDGATVRLKVARVTDDGSYLIVGESDFQTARSNQLETYQARIAVRAGDVIGTSSSDGKTVAYTGSNDDQVVLAPGDQPAGSVGTYSTVQGIRVNVSATVEADVDGDGFGDETQDLCTNDPNTQTACSGDIELTAASSKRIVHPGEIVPFALTVTDHGPSRSVGVTLTAQLSEELTLVGSDGADCGGTPVTCKLGDIEANQPVTVHLIARATRVGTGSVAASVNATTLDPNVTKNAAGASVLVQWRPGRCANVFFATPRNDVRTGTAAGDSIDGLAGNDTLDGLGGADCLSGALGEDRLIGDDGNDVLDGGPGNDSLRGGSGSDRISGGSGNDRIDGGSGPDRIHGDAGNDSISAIDGRRDTIDCGPGRHDVVRADRGDRLKHCEKVVYAKKKS